MVLRLLSIDIFKFFISGLQVQVHGMEGQLCCCGEMCQEEEEVECRLHDDLPTLEFLNLRLFTC